LGTGHSRGPGGAKNTRQFTDKHGAYHLGKIHIVKRDRKELRPFELKRGQLEIPVASKKRMDTKKNTNTQRKLPTL